MTRAGSRAGGAGDPRRWVALGFALLSVTVTVIDNTVLTVSIPQIMRDLDTDIAGVQWVFTGYALTFASLLVIGGRLGDLYGARRVLLTGMAMFGAGSFVASVSTSMPQMILGEAIIEGAGAALLVPNTLSVVARRFPDGRERAMAFAAWASMIGAAAVTGPLLGGYLTTYHSWRWSFRVNVIIAPLAIVGLLLTTPRDERVERGARLDLRGAALVASGMFLLVFGLTQGNGYGWGRPIGDFTIGGAQAWPDGAWLSPVPFAFVAGAALLALFVWTELALERGDGHPLFELSQFRHRTFRYANLATFFLAFAQLSTAVCIALYLQDGKHLSPMRTGLWVLPMGASILVGAPFGGWLSRRVGATNTTRLGAVLNVGGMLAVLVLLPRDISYWGVFPAFVLYGFSGGVVSSQMNNLMLHDISPEHTGAASGVNTTARQAATALGVAATGAIFAAVSTEQGVEAALRPALLIGVVALSASAAVMWKLPQIDPRASEPHQEPADLYVLLEPVNARIES
jgi:EmrB/QacA subfamily drug resistance transporter